MNPNLRRGFNRVFVVLTFVWVAYCLVGYPWQRREEAFEQYREEQEICSNGVDYIHPNDIGECLKRAERNWQANYQTWSGKNFYLGLWWILLLAVVGFPLIAYGCCRGAAAVGLWVWRGFSPKAVP
jgi:hypothetical protein